MIIAGTQRVQKVTFKSNKMEGGPNPFTFNQLTSLTLESLLPYARELSWRFMLCEKLVICLRGLSNCILDVWTSRERMECSGYHINEKKFVF